MSHYFAESTWSGVQVDKSGTEYRANVYFTHDSDITIILYKQYESFTYGPYRTKISSKSIQLFTPSLGEEDPTWYIEESTSKNLVLVYMPNSISEKKLILKRNN